MQKMWCKWPFGVLTTPRPADLSEGYMGESKAAELVSLSLSILYEERMLGAMGESTD
jgi:hypothetical protein